MSARVSGLAASGAALGNIQLAQHELTKANVELQAWRGTGVMSGRSTAHLITFQRFGGGKEMMPSDLLRVRVSDLNLKPAKGECNRGTERYATGNYSCLVALLTGFHGNVTQAAANQVSVFVQCILVVIRDF